MNQSEQSAAGIDETIVHMEKLYAAVTGKEAPPVEAGYAPIPAEKDPTQHVEEQVTRLLGLLGQVKPGLEATPSWAPPASVWENDSDVILCLDLPGLRRDEVEVVVQGNTVTVSGTRSSARDGLRLRSSEGGLGAFRRAFMVPAGIRSLEPSAQMRDGVLEIRLPKQLQQTVPKPVPVH